MAIHDPRDLQCWQLADAVRSEVIAICETKVLAHDPRFCNGFRDAAGSVCRNISEGFSRYESAQIVQFFRYALASLSEVKDYLRESAARGVITPAELGCLLDRCEHAKATALKFMRPHIAKTTPRRPRSGR